MELKHFFAQDLSGNIIPSPVVRLYEPGTTTLVAGLVDKDGGALSNPFTGTVQGLIQMAAPDGEYDLRVVGGGRDYTIRVQFLDASETVAAAQAAQAAAEAAQAAAEAAATAAAEAAGDAIEALNVAVLDAAQTFTAPQRGAATVDNDLSFNLNAGNNFSCTPAAGGALTFTNIAAAAGQGGIIKLVNASNYAITAAAGTKILAADLTTISATGTYLLSYYSDGTNVYVSVSGNLA